MGRSGFCARAGATRHPGYGRTGYCPRAPPGALRWADPVFARAARHPGYGRTGYCPRAAPAALRWADLVFARAARARAARHPGYGRTGYCPRAPPAALGWADPVFARARAHTSRLWANRVLPARAACRLEMGRSGFCARRARAARHPGYGRTGYCPRAPPAALRWADLVFARAARAARYPGYGRTGYCPRAPPAALDGQIRFLRAPRARRATSRLLANRVFPARAACRLEMGRSGFARAARARAARHPGFGRTWYCPRAPPAALRWADLVFARAARAPRDIPVMGEPGIARARRLPP